MIFNIFLQTHIPLSPGCNHRGKWSLGFLNSGLLVSFEVHWNTKVTHLFLLSPFSPWQQEMEDSKHQDSRVSTHWKWFLLESQAVFRVTANTNVLLLRSWVDTHFCKGSDSKCFGFVDHMFPSRTTSFFSCAWKQPQMSESGCISIKLDLQKQIMDWVWCMDLSLPTTSFNVVHTLNRCVLFWKRGSHERKQVSLYLLQMNEIFFWMALSIDMERRLCVCVYMYTLT